MQGLLKRGYEVAIFHRGTHEVDLPQEVEHIHNDPHFIESLEAGLGNRKFEVVISMYGRLRFIAQVMLARTHRLIAITGGPVYTGWGTESLPVPMPEDAPVETDTSVKGRYLIAISEQMVMEAHQKGHYNATIIRYPRVYGPLRRGEWSFIKRILDGRKRFILPDSGLNLQTRGYAENMAHAVLLAVDKPEKSAGQIYNAGDERLFTLRQWVELITQIMGYKWEMVEIPSVLARPAQIYGGNMHHRVFDLTKIKTELGYRDIVSVEEGLRRTIDWHVKNRPDPGGEEEQQLRDPFNYEAEDQIIRVYEECAQRILDVPFTLPELHHGYPHPRKVGLPRDEIGR